MDQKEQLEKLQKIIDRMMTTAIAPQLHIILEVTEKGELPVLMFELSDNAKKLLIAAGRGNTDGLFAMRRERALALYKDFPATSRWLQKGPPAGGFQLLTLVHEGSLLLNWDPKSGLCLEPGSLGEAALDRIRGKVFPSNALELTPQVDQPQAADDRCWASMKNWEWVKKMHPPPLPDDPNAFLQKFQGWPPCRGDDTLRYPTPEVAEKHRQTRPYVMGRWADMGMPVFELTHSFMASMILTDPSGVSCLAVHPPFHTFYLRLPTPFWELHLPLPCGEGHMKEPITGLWFSRRSTGVVLVLHTSQGAGLLLESLCPLSTEDVKVGSWLKTLSRMHHTAVAPPREDEMLLVQATKMVINICLYVAELHADHSMSLPPKMRKSKPARRGNPLPFVTVLCREVKLGREGIAAARSLASVRPGKRGTWNVLTRYMVRGYWKEQVCGPRKKLPGGKFTPWQQRRHQWQKPFWKGDGSILQHIYRMEDKDTEH